MKHNITILKQIINGHTKIIEIKGLDSRTLSTLIRLVVSVSLSIIEKINPGERNKIELKENSRGYCKEIYIERENNLTTADILDDMVERIKELDKEDTVEVIVEKKSIIYR